MCKRYQECNTDNDCHLIQWIPSQNYGKENWWGQFQGISENLGKLMKKFDNEEQEK